MQKKRELQAAGIELRQKGSRRRGINYNEEVAFEKKPAIGFYDTAEENQKSKEVGAEFRPQTLEQLEGRRRAVCPPLSSLSLSDGIANGIFRRATACEPCTLCAHTSASRAAPRVNMRLSVFAAQTL